MEDLGVDVKQILKCILKKQGGKIIVLLSSLEALLKVP
jgi:hypothetical protein